MEKDDNYTLYGFSCSWCKYKCVRRNDMQKHMQTKKHKKNVEDMENMGIMKINHSLQETTPAYDIKPVNKPIKPTITPVSTYEKSRPNTITKTEVKYSDNVYNIEINKCCCGKVYKHLSSLCKHRNKCGTYLAMKNKDECNKIVAAGIKGSISSDLPPYPPSQDTYESFDISRNSLETMDTSQNIVIEKKTPDINELVVNTLTEQSKINEELKNMIAEQNKIIAELSESSKITNITTNNTYNDNKFNLSLFLNTECKDAMNIMDFIDSLPVETRDLENMGNFGYVDGITRILLNGLRNLDVYKRPIHCSDPKRDSIYIKDNDIWEKDTGNNDKMKKVVKYVRHKNVKKIPEWQKENPTFSNMKSQTHLKYMNIVGNTMGGATDEEDEQLQNKIIKKVVPEIHIPKGPRFKLLYNA